MGKEKKMEFYDFVWIPKTKRGKNGWKIDDFVVVYFGILPDLSTKVGEKTTTFPLLYISNNPKGM